LVKPTNKQTNKEILMNPDRASQLLIRSPHPDDIPDLHAIISHPQVAESGLHLYTTEYSETQEVFARAKPGVHRLVGVLDGRVVVYGLLRQNLRSRMRHTGEPGVYVHPDYWGQGFGAAMFDRLLDLAQNWLNLWRIEVQTFAHNEAVAHLAEKFGFALEGVKRDSGFGNGRYHDIALYARLQPPPSAQSRQPSPPPIPPLRAADPAEIIIRPAHPDDTDNAYKIWSHPLVARTTLQLPSQEIWHSRKRLGEAPPPGVHRLVADHNGRVIGMSALHEDQHPRLAHSAGLGMGVLPEYWSMGIGSRLMAALLDLADNWLGLHRVELEVNTDNPAAIRLYEKFGFVIEGTKQYHAWGDGRLADSHFMGRIR
jgi:L-phenylalanine/L-methionine N-acetyltransferase